MSTEVVCLLFPLRFYMYSPQFWTMSWWLVVGMCSTDTSDFSFGIWVVPIQAGCNVAASDYTSRFQTSPYVLQTKGGAW